MDTKKLFTLLFYTDKWNIGWVRQSVQELVGSKKLGQVTWLPEDRAHYRADPFVVWYNDRLHVYYERLNMWQGRGKIFLLDLSACGAGQEVKGFHPSDVHLSYPYIFADQDGIHCIPETAEAYEVALYDVNSQEPAALSKRRVLLNGAPYMDSSMVYFNGRYWLFTSIRGQAGKLYIYYADSLQDGFIPHALNPVPCAAAATRSAGHLFTEGNFLYRPVQYSVREYGEAIVLNRISELTPTTIRSEPCLEILPQQPYGSGIHTLSIGGGLLVVDGKRKVFTPHKLLLKLIEKIVSLQTRKYGFYTQHPDGKLEMAPGGR